MYTFNPSALEAEAETLVSSGSTWKKREGGKERGKEGGRKGRTGEMAQRLKALAALSEFLDSIPSNYLVAYNHL